MNAEQLLDNYNELQKHKSFQRAQERNDQNESQ